MIFFILKVRICNNARDILGVVLEKWTRGDVWTERRTFNSSVWSYFQLLCSIKTDFIRKSHQQGTLGGGWSHCSAKYCWLARSLNVSEWILPVIQWIWLSYDIFTSKASLTQHQEYIPSEQERNRFFCNKVDSHIQKNIHWCHTQCSPSTYKSLLGFKLEIKLHPIMVYMRFLWIPSRHADDKNSDVFL